jgi:predicted membrane-bound mannosyltransferase
VQWRRILVFLAVASLVWYAVVAGSWSGVQLAHDLYLPTALALGSPESNAQKQQCIEHGACLILFLHVSDSVSPQARRLLPSPPSPSSSSLHQTLS